MADFAKINNVAAADIAKVNNVAKTDIANVNGATTPSAGTVCWMAVSTVGRIITSTSATAASGSWNAIHQPPDAGTDCKGLAFGKDNAGADRWIAIWDRGNNLASVSSTSVPTAEAHWVTLDLDTGDWDTGEGPNAVAYSNSTGTPMWVIVGSGGRVAYSSTGSNTVADWEVDIDQYAGYAGNRPIEGVAFSGSHIFLSGAKTKIVSGSVQSNWVNGNKIPWVFDDSDSLAQGTICMDENATVGNGTVAWTDIHAAGTGASTRFITISDSNNALNVPLIASGAHGGPCCGDATAAGGADGWHSIVHPAGTFGGHSTANARKMRGVAADDSGNWMIVGLIAQAFLSTDNGLTWSDISSNFPANPNGQSFANTNLMSIRWANVGGTSTWLVGGEDGYMAISTNNGSDWTAIPNHFSDAGTGANYHIQNIAFSAVTNWPGASNE